MKKVTIHLESPIFGIQQLVTYLKKGYEFLMPLSRDAWLTVDAVTQERKISKEPEEIDTALKIRTYHLPESLIKAISEEEATEWPPYFDEPDPES